MGFGFKRCVGHLPPGASHNMSVEPTTWRQGLVEIGIPNLLPLIQLRQERAQEQGRSRASP
jgi:hypothetical protein